MIDPKRLEAASGKRCCGHDRGEFDPKCEQCKAFIAGAHYGYAEAKRESDAELAAWKEIERLSERTRKEIYGMAYQLKPGKYGAKVLDVPSCSMAPESVKIHDDLCDILESRAMNEHGVCTASVGIWGAIAVCEKLWRDERDVLRAELAKAKEALNKIANADVYFDDCDELETCARETLAALKGGTK
jgi:hypothetical protein